MSFIKMYLITAAVGLAVAGGVSALSLHANVNRGNGGEPHHILTVPATDPAMTWSRPEHPPHGGNNSMSTEPSAHAAAPPIDHAVAFDN